MHKNVFLNTNCDVIMTLPIIFLYLQSVFFFLLPDLDVIGIFTPFSHFYLSGSFLGFFLITNKYVEYVNVTYKNKKYILFISPV